MGKLLSLLCLVALLGFATPAQAQLRGQASAQQNTVKLYGQEAPGFSLDRMFSPEHFRMHHSYEMSFGSFGGNSSSLGMYTNTMMFQFDQKLAARVDVAMAHSLFGDQLGQQFGMQRNDGARVFLRNAEIAYRPTENMRLHLSVRQSPYGRYMSPYGMGYGGYGGYGGYHGFEPDHRDLFWNDDLR